MGTCHCTGTTNDLSENGSYIYGSYSLALSGLVIDTQYSYKAYAINVFGTGYASCTSFYTSVNVPQISSVSPLSATSETVVLGENLNPVSATYAIYESSTGKYVQSDGTLGATAVWQTYSAWGGVVGITITGLEPNVQYSYQAKARNDGLVETSLSAAVSGYTLAVAPNQPSLANVADTSVVVKMPADSNSSTTDYVIYVSSMGKYVQSDGTLGSAAVWRTYAAWGGSLGVKVIGLTSDTGYTYQIGARNGDNVATSMSTGSSVVMLASSPGSFSASAPSTTTIALTWVSGGHQSKFNLYRNGISGTGSLIYSGDNLSYIDTGLSATTGYTYYLYAVNSNNDETAAYSTAHISTRSAVVTLATPTPTPLATEEPTPIPTAIASRVKNDNTPKSDHVTPKPVLKLSRQLINIVSGAPITFDATASTDNTTIAGYSWNFGDGTSSDSVAPIHDYSAPGVFTVSLKVTDTAGNSATSTTMIEVKPPSPTISNINSEGRSMVIIGKAYPLTVVVLTLHSNPVIRQTVANAHGDWSYTIVDVSKTLGLGAHNVVAVASLPLTNNDAVVSPQSQEYNFQVLVDNGQVKVMAQLVDLWRSIAAGLAGVLVVAGLAFVLIKRKVKKIKKKLQR